MKRSYPILLAVLLGASCQSFSLPYEKMPLDEVVSLVLQLKAPFDSRKNDAVLVLRERFPVGMSFDDVGLALSEIRKRHRYATQFNGIPTKEGASFYVYHYSDEYGSYRQDGLMLFFTFDANRRLKELSYAHSSFSF